MEVNKDLSPYLQQGDDFKFAKSVLERLVQQGFKVYFAGGCVRDALLNRPHKDIDLVTDALPEQVEQLFLNRTIAVGKKFGIIIVQQNGLQIEVATFRKEGDYHDGRHPLVVEYSDEREDAFRRDFTINALFYDFINKKVIDYVGGLNDLDNKIIRTVGPAEIRFSEDYLRILRLFRFSETLEFAIESDTFNRAIHKLPQLAQVSVERKRDELFKVFFEVSDQNKLIKKYQEFGLWKVFFNLDQLKTNPDFFVNNIQDEKTLLTALLWNTNNFHEILKKLKLSQKLTQFVSQSLKHKQKLSKILQSSEAEKRFCCLEEEFNLTLRLMDKIDPLNPEIKRLVLLSNHYLDQPPLPLLRGEDLIKYYQGKELGIALELVFKEQLVQNWQNKDQAMKWLLKIKT